MLSAMRIRRDPADDLLHAADDDPNFNESRYYNLYDPGTGFGGWMRMGNRPNEHYAEMTVCMYLPDGSVGFMFQRPRIEGHSAHDAGGLRFEVVEPFREHHVTFDGELCVLANPRDMANPGAAFASNPHQACSIDLSLTALADATGSPILWCRGSRASDPGVPSVQLSPPSRPGCAPPPPSCGRPQRPAQAAPMLARRCGGASRSLRSCLGLRLGGASVGPPPASPPDHR